MWLSIQIMYLLRVLILGITLLLATSHALQGQCCAPGNPIGGAIAAGVNDVGSTRLFMGYRYGYSGNYLEGAQPAITSFIQQGQFQHLSLSLTHGLSERLTIVGETGYFVQKRQTYQEGIQPAQQNGQGLTDLQVLARLNVWREQVHGWEVTMGLGVKVPMGTYRQEVDGILLPRDLQPSTGSIDGIYTLFVEKAVLPHKYRLFLRSRFEIRSQNPDGYRYGHLLMLSGFASYQLRPTWTTVAQLRGEWWGRDTRTFTGTGIPLANGREQIIPTGSYKLFLSPQIGYQPHPQWRIMALADIPLYQYYHGSQLATTISLLLGVSYAFSAKSEAM